MRKVMLMIALWAAGCASATDPAVDRLSGTWRWVGSSGGIAGMTYSPEQNHYTVNFTFENGRLRAFRNDSLKVTTNISLSGEKLTFEPPVSVFHFAGAIEEETLRVVSADTMVLDDGCCDRFAHMFVRQRQGVAGPNPSFRSPDR